MGSSWAPSSVPGTGNHVPGNPNGLSNGSVYNGSVALREEGLRGDSGVDEAASLSIPSEKGHLLCFGSGETRLIRDRAEVLRYWAVLGETKERNYWGTAAHPKPFRVGIPDLSFIRWPPAARHRGAGEKSAVDAL